MTIGILFPFLLIALASYSLWKSCSNFDRYSKVIGDQLTDGVRGATVNAIGSSLPCHQGKTSQTYHKHLFLRGNYQSVSIFQPVIFWKIP